MSRQRAGTLLLAGTALASAALATAALAEDLPPPVSPDVVLITIDTLRADALGFAGAEVATPHLDRLAAAGRVFTGAHAHNVVTLPSHANILTGLHPYQHGVRENSGFRLPSDIPTLATVLAAAGWETAAFVAAEPLDARYGLACGFDVYDDRLPRGASATEFVLAERRGDEVIGRAVAWWREHREHRRFLWVHLFDPHAPYAPPEPFASRHAASPYLGEVAATDAFLGPLLAPLFAAGAPPALVVLTSDHGEALGDHGELTHGLFAYEATLRVPLVLWGPGVTPGRDDRPARHVDLLPTVLDALGLALPAGFAYPGRSLLAPPGAGVDTYFEALSATFNRGWAPLRGVIRDGRKFIALPMPELYDLRRDPAEASNRVDAERPLARALLAALPEESQWPPRRGRTTAEELAALRSLGYLSANAPLRATYGPEDDPKRLVALDRQLHRMVELYSLGRPRDAAELGRQLVAARPSMALGRSLLAQALLESGATAEALEVMLEAREQGVVTETLLRQLGLTLAQVGRTDEALAVLHPLVEGGDLRALDALGLALSEAGRQEEAEAALRRSVEADPDNATAWEGLALVALRRGRWAPALAHAQRAVELDDGLARAWNDLGVAAWELGDVDAAFAAWERATGLDPELWDALYNLGTRALEEGRTDLARDALARFTSGAPASRYGDDLRRARVLLARLERAAQRP